MSGLGLMRNTDVLLGTRQGRVIESSNYSYRRIQKRKSPSPHAKIVMEKLQSLGTHHVHLCNLCDFIGSSKKEVRNHKREKHLKKCAKRQEPASAAAAAAAT